MTDRELSEQIAALQEVLTASGLHGALGHLNRRTPYRFTGVYRYDGDTLHNIALFDRWSPGIDQGDDAPMGETFCAIVGDTGEWLEVTDGRQDPRFPWMHENAVVCYCGTLIRDPAGKPFGTLCHFDVQRCQPSRNEIDLLRASGPLLYRFLAGTPPDAFSDFPSASSSRPISPAITR